ncbi:MAG: hypothetical protein N2167_04010 [Flavobacteriales bacterium]|nr:hypothetical protein [Flavobacteriales bacterium]
MKYILACVVCVINLLILNGYSQDVILLLNGKEIPALVEKEDSIWIYYTQLTKAKYIEKSTVKEIRKTEMELLNGQVLPYVFLIDSFDRHSPYVYYRELKKPFTLRKEKVFNVRTRSVVPFKPYDDSLKITEKERVIYHQDTLDRRFELSEYEMRCWVMGRRSARKHYHSPFSTIGGTLTGFGGGMFNLFVAPLPATIFTAVNGAIRPKVGKTGKEDIPYLNEEFFIEGYRMQAGKKKLFNSLIGTVPALVGGVLINYYLIK